ncbi:guanine nucleotide-exchange factor [Babesia ovis]|uniref:Guanine nucleotide-exchange factor n=1 Tax=Babesia ovis TaxID=5869 RepID=A0A9W5TD20_BABOV|nr:guanine nucleotide-exchange factor [Babesia ovis]
MGTVKLLKYPIYALATDGQYLVTSGGGGGEEYGISDRVEFYSISDVGGRAELLQKGSIVDQIGVLDSVEFIEIHNLWMGSVNNGTVFFSYRPSNGVNVYGRVLIARKKNDAQQTVAKFCRGSRYFITGNSDGTVCMWKLSNRFMEMMDELEENITDGTRTPTAHTDNYAPSDDLAGVNQESIPITVKTSRSRSSSVAPSEIDNTIMKTSDEETVVDDDAIESRKEKDTVDDTSATSEVDDLASTGRSITTEICDTVPVSPTTDTAPRHTLLPEKALEIPNAFPLLASFDAENSGNDGYTNGNTTTDHGDEHTDGDSDSDNIYFHQLPGTERNVAVKFAMFKCHANEVTDCDICHDARIAIAVSRDKMVLYQVSPPKILYKQKSTMAFKFARFINMNCQNGFYQFLTIEWDSKRPCESVVGMWRYTAETNSALLVKSSSLGRDPCSAMCLSPDEVYFALGFGTGDVGVYDVRSLQCLVHEQRHQLPVTDVAFLGDKLVSSGADFYVIIKRIQRSYFLTVLTIIIPIIAYLIYIFRHRASL